MSKFMRDADKIANEENKLYTRTEHGLGGGIGTANIPNDLTQNYSPIKFTRKKADAKKITKKELLDEETIEGLKSDKTPKNNTHQYIELEIDEETQKWIPR